MKYRTSLLSGNKKMILFLMMIILTTSNIFGQKQDDEYEKEWIKVDAFIKKALPRSAMEIIEQVYAKAIKENNQPEQIKAVLYKIILANDLEEEDQEYSINLVISELKTASFPASAIYHSILAELYWDYYENNRWDWLKRTPLEQSDENDIRTWDLKKLISKVIEHHMLALSRGGELKSIPRDSYRILLNEDIFNSEKQKQDAIKARPTLFDFLAHRAVDRFTNSETSITRPADQFILDNPSYLSSYQIYSNLKLSTGDTLSLPFHALKILQDLILFHIADTDPAALIDVDLRRLQIVEGLAVLADKDKLYEQSLKALQDKFSDNPASAEVAFSRAQHFHIMAGDYKPLVSDEHKGDNTYAVSICEDINKRWPKSSGAANCRVLMQQIKELSLSLKTDDVVVPRQPFLGLCTYKNIDTLWYRIIATDPSKYKDIRQSGDSKKMLSTLISMASYRTGSLELPADKDYNAHNLQIPFPELPAGYYILLLSPRQNFNIEETSVAYASCWSSDLSYISRKNAQGDLEVYILNRQSGKAVEKATVECWTSDYDYKSRSRNEKLWQSHLTDDDGYVRIPSPVDKINRSIYLLIRKDKDQLASDEYFYMSVNIPNKVENRIRTFLFTDRAIYRPGQTIYYKGIVTEGKGNDLKVNANLSTRVFLYDVNNRLIGETAVNTNEYGSFSGTFTAPSGVLTGQMRIMNEYGSVDFSVEEYKRPRFEVEFDTIDAEYKLNETITVKGKAKTFSGNPVDGAGVSYRVVRTARFPYWFDYMGIIPSSPSEEIANGQTITGSNGEFSLNFTAIPDRMIPVRYAPVFHYEIVADVTDINGEVRSSRTLVSAGYASFILQTDLPAKVNSSEFKGIILSAENLAGKDVKVNVQLMISQLKRPDHLFRPRKWERPDKFCMNEPDFHKQFPLDIYDNEDNKDSWTETVVKMAKNLSLPSDSLVIPEDINTWPAGDYCLKLISIDKSGDTIRYKKYFTLYDQKRKKLPPGVMNWFNITERPVEPGTEVSISLGSSANDVSVLYELIKGNDVISRKWLKINNEMIEFQLPVLEDYRGNIGVCYTFVKDNRYYQELKTLKVPYTNKDLDISFETFRDKLQPGQKEEWKLKIAGRLKEKVAAELLLGMYDASLDAFVPHFWSMDLYSRNNYFSPWRCQDVFSLQNTSQSYFHYKPNTETYYYRIYDRLILLNDRSYNVMFRAEDKVMTNGVYTNAVSNDDNHSIPARPKYLRKDKAEIPEVPAETNQLPLVSPRTNLNETAFFFPDLKTDENGNIIVKFTLPESLTRWKVLGLAHTKDLKTGTLIREITAQKELMVFPNPPRIFREGDKITFSAKISSLSKENLSGKVSLELFDAITMKRIDNELYNDASQIITLTAGASVSSEWTFRVPFNYQAITWRVSAYCNNYSDAEESTVPVLTNRALVTESLTLPVRGKGNFSFSLSKLAGLEKHPSQTLLNHRLSLEFTSNPAWYAIQSLPYLIEFPYECSEQLFNRMYANQLATHIASSDPSIRKVFETWARLTPSSLLSNLDKNQDLKSVVLEESPWVMEAKDESERKQRVGLLFDLNRMANESVSATEKLIQLQTPGGGWSWFKGMPDNLYITQYILSGYGHMLKLGVIDDLKTGENYSMVEKALRYTDGKIREYYDNLLKYSGRTIQDNNLSYTAIQYLYMRSFYIDDFEYSANAEEAARYFRGQAVKYWTTQNIYMQGMIALALHRMGDAKTSGEIIRSLNERALHSQELGMYWKGMSPGYYWYQQAVATQALLIEAFDEIRHDSLAVEDMKVWLLKQKQTHDWKTTTATADACYALLLRGTSLLSNTSQPVITIGKETLDPQHDPSLSAEAGTGYFMKSWDGKDVNPSMAVVNVKKENAGLSWGALYWQYFEDFDKITPAEGPIKVTRQLFIRRLTASGPVLDKVTPGNPIHLGDKVVVRINLVSDRDMEFVHMKDLRAAGLEPVDVLSGYRYQDGAGYYVSTRDAATHFFFDRLPKGSRIFEYTLNASQKGEFSQGITNIECMYAPEFAAHSEGGILKIE